MTASSGVLLNAIATTYEIGINVYNTQQNIDLYINEQLVASLVTSGDSNDIPGVGGYAYVAGTSGVWVAVMDIAVTTRLGEI